MWASDNMTIPFASCAHGTTVHQNHLWNILTQIPLTYPKRQCFILFTVGLCLYVHRKPSRCFWGTAGVESYCTLHTLRIQANFKQQTNISWSNNLIYSVAAWNTKLKRMLKPEQVQTAWIQTVTLVLIACVTVCSSFLICKHG